MRRVTGKTLVLLVQLLMAVVAYQCLALATPTQAGPVWLDDEPAPPVDPNEPAEPMPESIRPVGAKVWLDAEPAPPVDPNEPAEPMPEST